MPINFKTKIRNREKLHIGTRSLTQLFTQENSIVMSAEPTLALLAEIFRLTSTVTM